MQNIDARASPGSGSGIWIWSDFQIPFAWTRSRRQYGRQPAIKLGRNAPMRCPWSFYEIPIRRGLLPSRFFTAFCSCLFSSWSIRTMIIRVAVMLFNPKYQERPDRLLEQLHRATALTHGLLSDVIARTCPRLA